jgi:RimJ/RimL family protein N-acetyltransferase
MNDDQPKHTSVPDLEPSPCRLTALRRTDAQPLFEWINDRDTALHNNRYSPIHESDHLRWLDSVVSAPDIRVFAIRDSQERLIGVCQLVHIDPVGRSAELRIRIGLASDRGRGCGSHAVKELLRFAFDDLNLHRVYLHVFATNERAIRTYKRVGFREEGRLVEADYVDGRYVDVLCMAMLQREYAAASERRA